MSGLIFIRDNSIQYSIFNRTFQSPDFTARLQTEGFHDFLPTYRRLKITNPVFLLQVFQFLTNQLEIIQETLLTLHIL